MDLDRVRVSEPSNIVAAICIALLLAAAAPACKNAASIRPTSDQVGLTSGPKTVKFDPKALERHGIRVEAAGSSSAARRLQVPGSLEYDLQRYAEVGTVVEGRVQALYAAIGDRVQKGQRLGVLRVPSIANIQAEYLSALAAAKSAEANLRREEALLGKALTTAREAEVARAEMSRAQAELGATSARLEALGVGRPTSNTSIHGAGLLALTAPISGEVVRRDAVLGGFLRPEERAFVIADPTELRAVVEVYEGDLIYFRIGSQVDLAIDAIPGRIVKGTIAVIQPQLGKETRALRALIVVPNPDNTLRAGLFVRASIALPEDAAASSLLVPAGAVQPLGDDEVVFVESAIGTFEVRKVHVATRSPQIVQIADGLTRGERIAVEGAFLLRGQVTKQ